jgi:hypothetical protein
MALAGRPTPVSAMADLTFTLSLNLRGKPYVLTVTPGGFRLVPRGRRQSVELPWTAFLDEDAALYSELYKSIHRLRSRTRAKHKPLSAQR